MARVQYLLELFSLLDIDPGPDLEAAYQVLWSVIQPVEASNWVMV